MIVIGAKGFAKELLEVLISDKYKHSENDLFFFDNITVPKRKYLFNKFKILTSFSEVKIYFENISKDFCIGIGNPLLRYKLVSEFRFLGGNLVSIISSNANIGKFGTEIGVGTTIIGNAVITNDIKIGEGCLIYMNTSITHDVNIGKYVQISPGVSIAGRTKIGDFTSIGIGASILPNIIIGSNCIIGAGSVITKNIPDNSIVVGIPGKIIKNNRSMIL